MNDDELDRKVSRSDDRSLYKVVQENDLAYNMMRAWQGGFGTARVPGLVSPAYVVCRPKSAARSEYFELVLRTPNAISELKRFSRGITDFRLRLYWEDFKTIQVPLPPENERQLIAKFLDYETAKIDALIEKQRQLIALLQEKRQAVISHAVTKGLNPDAPMRDSGVEWLGEVPAHWGVKRLKHCLEGNGIQMGPFGTSLTGVLREPSAYCVYGQSNTISGDFSATSRWLTEELFRPLAHYRLEPRDIVLTRKGSLGNCRVVPDDIAPGIMDSDTIRIRTRTADLAPEYLANLMHNARYVEVQIDLNRRGAILPGLNSNVVGNLFLAVPPPAEQAQILDGVGVKLRRIDGVSDRVHEQISCLAERRTALISAAVTGKIDVRGWKPPESKTAAEVA
ncbi:MAG: restriction endonuclease subunit S [Thermoanaerobaculia bacterium]|nr:restriction endonuclease subunit S [Thermoanaerobaculia bacterium]